MWFINAGTKTDSSSTSYALLAHNTPNPAENEKNLTRSRIIYCIDNSLDINPGPRANRGRHQTTSDSCVSFDGIPTEMTPHPRSPQQQQQPCWSLKAVLFSCFSCGNYFRKPGPKAAQLSRTTQTSRAGSACVS